MEPIATYSEVRFDGKRTFMLFPDKIFIRGKTTFKSDFEFEIPLVSLNPNYDRINIRNSAFVAGGWMAIISFVVSSILISALKLKLDNFVLGLMIVFGISGLILSAATYRKVQFLCFKNLGGGRVFDIARAGKQAERLDLFIYTLTKQIQLARGAA